MLVCIYLYTILKLSLLYVIVILINGATHMGNPNQVILTPEQHEVLLNRVKNHSYWSKEADELAAPGFVVANRAGLLEQILITGNDPENMTIAMTPDQVVEEYAALRFMLHMDEVIIAPAI